MSSRGKKKTTMAKLTRESRLRERKLEKQIRKEARRDAPPEESIGYADNEITPELAAIELARATRTAAAERG